MTSGLFPQVGLCCAGSRYLEPDGTFPNHSPNPEDKEAMKAGSEAVQQSGSDLGIVVDTVRIFLVGFKVMLQVTERAMCAACYQASARTLCRSFAQASFEEWVTTNDILHTIGFPQEFYFHESYLQDSGLCRVILYILTKAEQNKTNFAVG